MHWAVELRPLVLAPACCLATGQRESRAPQFIMIPRFTGADICPATRRDQRIISHSPRVFLVATYFAVLGKSRPSRSILSKAVPCVEQQPIALTPHPVLLSEARAFSERVGHKVEALQQQPTDTKTELTETTAELSEIQVRILL